MPSLLQGSQAGRKITHALSPPIPMWEVWEGSPSHCQQCAGPATRAKRWVHQQWVQDQPCSCRTVTEIHTSVHRKMSSVHYFGRTVGNQGTFLIWRIQSNSLRDRKKGSEKESYHNLGGNFLLYTLYDAGVLIQVRCLQSDGRGGLSVSQEHRGFSCLRIYKGRNRGKPTYCSSSQFVWKR